MSILANALRPAVRAVIWQMIQDQDNALAKQIADWWAEKTGERL